jgi:hypothetical protein
MDLLTLSDMTLSLSLNRFGATAVALEMIPIANFFFVWTNIVGCALWVADEIEQEEAHLQQDQSSQSLMGTPIDTQAEYSHMV